MDLYAAKIVLGQTICGAGSVSGVLKERHRTCIYLLLCMLKVDEMESYDVYP